MKWTYGTKWLTYDIIHSFEQTQFIWFIPQYDTLYSCGSLLPNLRADINLELPKVLKVLSVMLSILMIFFFLQHCYAMGEFWLVPRLRKGSIIWAQFYFWYFASTIIWWSSKYHPSIYVWRIVNIVYDNFAWIAFLLLCVDNFCSKGLLFVTNGPTMSLTEVSTDAWEENRSKNDSYLNMKRGAKSTEFVF